MNGINLIIVSLKGLECAVCVVVWYGVVCSLVGQMMSLSEWN